MFTVQPGKTEVTATRGGTKLTCPSTARKAVPNVEARLMKSHLHAASPLSVSAKWSVPLQLKISFLRRKSCLFHIYWDFRIKFCCVKKRFGFYFDQSERRNEFLTREKIVSSNHKPRFKRIVFSRAFSRSSRVALSSSFDKIIFSVYSSCS